MARTLPLVPQVVKLKLTYTNGGFHWSNSIHFFTSTTAITQAQCIALANAANLYWASDMAPQVHVNTSLFMTEATGLDFNPPGYGSNSTVVPGTHVGNPLPDSACVLLNYATVLKYRGGKPRTYFPGGVDTSTTDGRTWIPAFQQAFIAGYSGFINGMVAAPGVPAQMVPCAVSYYHGFTLVTNPITGRGKNVPNIRTTPLVLLLQLGTVNQTIGSQRRRLRSR